MSSTLRPPPIEELQELLDPIGQAHLLRFWEQLTIVQRHKLDKQIRSIDWSTFSQLAGNETNHEVWSDLARRAEPPEAITLADLADPERSKQARDAGTLALAQGKVAFVLVAGGQGSRLGFDHPKGMFPIGPVSGRPLFQFILEHCLARGLDAGKTIPVCIMTSPQTDLETNQFLNARNWFGYPRSLITTFCQGVIPAIDSQTKQVLMAEPDELFVNPDGHGGCLSALQRSGILAELKQRGIEYLFYGQIDNPLLQVCDPTLIGYHILRQSEMTTQVVRKQTPTQKVGNVVRIDGRTQIIEYSELPTTIAERRDDSGELKFWAGSIAVHVFDRQFLERCAAHAETLPFHKALKKVSHIDERGRRAQPTEPNAIKFERFIFDLLPHATRAIVCEVDPADGFAAVKNAEPAPTETATWVQSAIVKLHRGWLEAAGAVVAPDIAIEISPFFALDAEQVALKIHPGQKFDTSTYITNSNEARTCESDRSWDRR